MKRTLSVATLLGLVATVASATSVTSANTVGYQTLAIKGGTFNMLAVNWDEVGGSDIMIQDLFDTASLTAGDQILVWNPLTSGYKAYYLYDQASTYPGWAGAWVDFDTGNISADTFGPGSAFWLQVAGADTDVTIDGQVPTDASAVKTMKAGTFTMVGASHSADLELNGANLAVADGVAGDQILVWNPATSGYKVYYMYDTASTYPGWAGAWVDFDTGDITTDSLLMGQGAWYQSGGGVDVTWTETKPY